MNVNTIRSGLASVARGALPDTVQVYPSGLEPLAEFPAVIIDQPSWTPSAQIGLPYPTGRLRWPVRVVLEKPGTQDPTTVEVLDQLWTSLLTAYDAETNRVTFALNLDVDHAEFGPVLVQGQEYPAQTIFVDTYPNP